MVICVAEVFNSSSFVTCVSSLTQGLPLHQSVHLTILCLTVQQVSFMFLGTLLSHAKIQFYNHRKNGISGILSLGNSSRFWSKLMWCHFNVWLVSYQKISRLFTSAYSERNVSVARFPDVPGVDKDDCNAFRRTLLLCKMRIVTKPIRCWIVEVSYFLKYMRNKTFDGLPICRITQETESQADTTFVY